MSFGFTIFFVLKICACSNFGYISYATLNIGDDIQAIAAKNFLPEDSLGIDREFIAEFKSNSVISTIVNGWYMHTKNGLWYRPDVSAPEKSWPPSPSLDPLLISIHFTKQFAPLALSDEGIAYLKYHGPVGARDYYTLGELQKKNIPSYFSGCLTLTLKNSNKKRDVIIYAVDIDRECVEFIKSKTKCKVETLTHNIRGAMQLNQKLRMQYAESILEKYRTAKCVITSRLHAALPCIAFETPVLLIETKNEPSRFNGLGELMKSCTKAQFLNNNVDFDFDKPPKNSNSYLPIRENLIKIVTDWVTRKSK